MRAHWMLHELNREYQARLIGSRSGETQTAEFQQLNLKEKIPVLVDGHLVLSESVAIVTYLGDCYGRSSGLVPEAYTSARAKYNEWMSFAQMELDAHTLYVIRRHRDLANLYGEAPAAIEAAIAGFNKQVLAVSAALQQTEYLLGNSFSAVDLVMTTCLGWADSYGIEMDERLVSYYQQIMRRDAYRSAAELNYSISPGG